MPLFTRVEFSVGPSLKSRRVVLLLEFPDEVLQQIHKRKSGSEVEAYPIALEAIGALKFDVAHGGMTFISSTPGKISGGQRQRVALGRAIVRRRCFSSTNRCLTW